MLQIRSAPLRFLSTCCRVQGSPVPAAGSPLAVSSSPHPPAASSPLAAVSSPHAAAGALPAASSPSASPAAAGAPSTPGRGGTGVSQFLRLLLCALLLHGHPSMGAGTSCPPALCVLLRAASARIPFFPHHLITQSPLGLECAQAPLGLLAHLRLPKGTQRAQRGVQRPWQSRGYPAAWVHRRRRPSRRPRRPGEHGVLHERPLPSGCVPSCCVCSLRVHLAECVHA